MTSPSTHKGTAHSSTGHPGWAHAEVRDDVIEIATRAHRHGLCRRRVATALDATRYEMAVIEEEISLTLPRVGRTPRR